MISIFCGTQNIILQIIIITIQLLILLDKPKRKSYNSSDKLLVQWQRAMKYSARKLMQKWLQLGKCCLGKGGLIMNYYRLTLLYYGLNKENVVNENDKDWCGYINIIHHIQVRPAASLSLFEVKCFEKERGPNFASN